VHSRHQKRERERQLSAKKLSHHTHWNLWRVWKGGSFTRLCTVAVSKLMVAAKNLRPQHVRCDVQCLCGCCCKWVRLGAEKMCLYSCMPTNMPTVSSTVKQTLMSKQFPITQVNMPTVTQYPQYVSNAPELHMSAHLGPNLNGP